MIFYFIIFFLSLYNALCEDDINENINKKIIGKFQSWTVLSAKPNQRPMCYAIIYAESSIGNVASPKDIHEKPFLILHYLSANKQKISIFTGNDLRKDSKAYISIDGMQFTLMPYKESALPMNKNDERKIIQALLESKRMLIRSQTKNYKYQIDGFNLSGAWEVMNLMDAKCSDEIAAYLASKSGKLIKQTNKDEKTEETSDATFMNDSADFYNSLSDDKLQKIQQTPKPISEFDVQEKKDDTGTPEAKSEVQPSVTDENQVKEKIPL